MLVGDYGQTFRLPEDHLRLSKLPIVMDHPENLQGLIQQLTSNYNVVFASQRVVNWIMWKNLSYLIRQDYHRCLST